MSLSTEVLREAANRLTEAAKTGEFCAPVRDLLGVTDLKNAYEVQKIIAQRRIAQGAKVVGRKIGLTSKVVQAQLGVDQPDFGLLFDTMQIEDQGSISFGELTQPRIEAEVALTLQHDLPTGHIAMNDLQPAIGSVRAALEIVGSRIANWDIKITDTIADNASASHFVLGSESKSLQEVDLIGCAMTMYKNHELVAEGHGRDCLGSPLQAALWLAQTMSEFGNPLKRGDIILTGALGPMSILQPGDQVNAHIEGIGKVGVRINP